MGYNLKHPLHALLVEKITGYISYENELHLQEALVGDEELRELWDHILTKHTTRGHAFFNSLDEEKAWQNISSAIIKAQKQE